MTERIVIEIDDSQLDSVLGRLETVSTVAKATTGSTNLAQSLPTINRNMRVILGQLPGMREVMQAYFRLRWELQEYSEGGLAGMGFLLSTIATIIILKKELEQFLKRLKRDRDEFERFVMKSRRLTKEEFDRERVLWKYYLKGQP